MKRAIESNFDELEFKKGSLVWGKYGKAWWAAIVVNTDSCDFRRTKYNIMWLNDYTTSVLKVQDLLHFAEYFENVITRFSKRMSKGWRRGVVAALEELYNHDQSFKPEELENLAKCGLQNVPPRVHRIPQSVQTALDKKDEDNFEVYKNKCPDKYKRLFRNLLSRGKILQGERVCLGCYADDDVCQNHPILEGFLCSNCHKRLKRTLNTVGDDGLHFFCSICGYGGHTILCESGFCGKAYCVKCVEDFCKEGTWECFVKEEKWSCFLCSGKPKIGVLRIKADYNLEVDKMLYSDATQSPFIKTPSRPYPKGTKLRVLSLFDGISTGLFTLSKLNIPIDAYYASEIDLTCISVSKFHFKEQVKHIGDVTVIREEDIKRMSPIHLVIGGSPCTDLSLVNPARKGLFDPTGTGYLFFEFYRVLSMVLKQNQNGFYWLYENVASMELDSKEVITRRSLRFGSTQTKTILGEFTSFTPTDASDRKQPSRFFMALSYCKSPEIGYSYH
ncbi:DNA (cytosine-5)-methyltransferase 3B-like isoform X2 [Photinus pyralis]|uniref:DNA (cytosine-5)-methyltransferase 3B-like isoform X2 n=1 Tax=Photinus pyralis TaxID=7054 RepID=UPI00126725C6|nr:DNA (cytosine-5)-methyltransferase 3B-like isoform X2 [Photinus pyralis]